jgi:hypothetical protein
VVIDEEAGRLASPAAQGGRLIGVAADRQFQATSASHEGSPGKAKNRLSDSAKSRK